MIFLRSFCLLSLQKKLQRAKRERGIPSCSAPGEQCVLRAHPRSRMWLGAVEPLTGLPPPLGLSPRSPG